MARFAFAPTAFLAIVIGACGGVGNVCPPPGQGASQLCCASDGIDACGAGLFCAAFDGRTIATCYVERTRADESECTEDRQCESASCNATVGKCRSLYGLPCTPDTGCAAAPDRRYACAIRDHYTPNTCMPVSPNAATGALCIDATDCDSRLCVDSACSDPVISPPACDRSPDCDDDLPHCVGGACYYGGVGDPCAKASDCDVSSHHCVAGLCANATALGAACATSEECYNGHFSTRICDPTKLVCVLASNSPCDAYSPCEMGTTCKATPTGHCHDTPSKSCAGALCNNYSYEMCDGGMTWAS